jgi:hypothetical protein
LTMSPTATLYCLPPVLTIAYVTFSAAIVLVFLYIAVAGARHPKAANAGLGCGCGCAPLTDTVTGPVGHRAERQLLKVT